VARIPRVAALPEPKHPVELALEKRQDDGSFRQIFAEKIDPTSRFVDRSALRSAGQVTALFENGPPATKVDLLVVSDGYTARQAGEVPGGRAAVDERVVRDRALQATQAGLQRARAVRSFARGRHSQPAQG
jgi:hypothetical protein